MSAEPLSREERERVADHYAKVYKDRSYIRLDVERLLATAQAAEERAERMEAALRKARQYVAGYERPKMRRPEVVAMIDAALAADDAARGDL